MEFLFDRILPAEHICNLHEDRERLKRAADLAEHLVYYGKRNRGKTSLVQSILIPYLRKKHANSLIVETDLLGVQSMSDIDNRLKSAYERALSVANPTRSYIEGIVSAIKGIRPTLSTDTLSGNISFSLGYEASHKTISFADILIQCERFADEGFVCIILDEFQDVANVDGAEALFRTVWQNSKKAFPIFILGSHKHMLSQIFGDPASALANWGRFYEVGSISAVDYLAYVQERFTEKDLKISLEVIEYMQKRLQYNPECMNICCNSIKQTMSESIITISDVENTILRVVQERRDVYRETLRRFSATEQKVIRALAHLEPEPQPTGKAFLRQADSSSGSVRPIFKKLLNQAFIYDDEDGYVLADPLLSVFIKENG
jgi:hypothetical protein